MLNSSSFPMKYLKYNPSRTYRTKGWAIEGVLLSYRISFLKIVKMLCSKLATSIKNVNNVCTSNKIKLSSRLIRLTCFLFCWLSILKNRFMLWCAWGNIYSLKRWKLRTWISWNSVWGCHTCPYQTCWTTTIDIHVNIVWLLSWRHWSKPS